MKKLSLVLLIPLVIVGIIVVVVLGMKVQNEVASGKGIQYPGIFGGGGNPSVGYASLESATNEQLITELDTTVIDDGEADLNALDSELNQL